MHLIGLIQQRLCGHNFLGERYGHNSLDIAYLLALAHHFRNNANPLPAQVPRLCARCPHDHRRASS